MLNIENRKTKRIVFMGTPEFAAVSLKSLIDNNFNIVGVFTNPDKPSGRGMKITMSPVKELALNNNIPVFQPQKLRKNEEVLEILNDLNPDVIVVVAYRKNTSKGNIRFPKIWMYKCTWLFTSKI